MVIELCDNLGVDNLCRSSYNNLLMSMWWMTRWRVYLYGGQLMIVPSHGYRHGNQPMGELEDQHMAKPDLEDQYLNTSHQWVDAFCDESQSSSYHPDMGGSNSFHPKQPPISFDMFGNNMYSTPP
ncbi:hypothetical protein GOBAR_DD07180 [Gossypium barbadense]|nr:hypothetical protein GOBAR_DD07180 [Gossypium barbadense]